MEKVFIVRHSTGKMGTVGVLHKDSFICPTLELPWYNNIGQYSCILAGEYVAKYTYSPHMKRYTYELMNVPNRSKVRIHSGNYAGDSRLGYLTHVLGCFLLGKKIYEKAGPKKQLMIGTSSVVVTSFENLMKKKPFILNVSWTPDQPKPF